MAVTVDATGTTGETASMVTTFNYNNITVGSISNGALIFLAFINGGSPAPTGITATWDNGGTNQAMNPRASSTAAGGTDTVVVFGLRNPTAGNKTLAISWTNAASITSCAISFAGVDQVSDATAFPNPNTNSANSASASLSVTSATNDIPVAVVGTSNISGAINQTTIFHGSGSVNDGAGQRAAGAASVSFTASVASARWQYAGCDVAQVSAGGPALNYQPLVMM